MDFPYKEGHCNNWSTQKTDFEIQVGNTANREVPR